MHGAQDAIRPPWRPLRELLDSTTWWQTRIAAVAQALGSSAAPGTAVPLRVAVSVAQLGVAARLIAPALGAAVAGNVLLPLGGDEVWWQDRLGGPFPLSVPSVQPVQPVPPLPTGDGSQEAAQIGAALRERLLTGSMARIVAVTGPLSVSPNVLWGNVASAINGAASMIGRARPELASSAVALAGTLLEYPPLQEASQGEVGADFRRRSCCLIYLLSDRTRRALCGDCVLQQQLAQRQRPDAPLDDGK